MVNVGPIEPISSKAIEAMDKISEILKNTPKSEWKFVLRQAEMKADEEVKIKYSITKTRCIHQLTGSDIPPGLQPEDVAKECGIDCPKFSSKKII